MKKNEILKQKVVFLILIIKETLSRKWTLQRLLIYSQLQKPGKNYFKCFVLRTYLQFWISFSTSAPKILLLSFQLEKNSIFDLCDFCIFKCHQYNAKVSSRTGGA